MSTDAVILGAILVYAALFGVSKTFNSYIDGQPAGHRPDGVTALWVVFGVVYTLLGGTVLVWLTFGWMLVLATQFGAAAASALAGLLYVSAFVASGTPMIWADAHRSYRERSIAATLRGQQED